jgi:hypothetical protein
MMFAPGAIKMPPVGAVQLTVMAYAALELAKLVMTGAVVYWSGFAVKFRTTAGGLPVPNGGVDVSASVHWTLMGAAVTFRAKIAAVL